VETPEQLPWLIRLDEFVDGQLHQGYADIVVRSNNSSTSLNEAVALDLLDGASLASQQAISTSFSVNGGDPVLRLAIEHPDDDAWQDRSFGAPGALYKAESTGDWSYRGDDPEAYTDVFDQEGGKKVADLTPLIDFLRFINEADDETFVAELGDRLDVDAFATYLAMMDLTENFDDIDGPGNNAYLWWDEESGRFTLVPWDLNLAFGAMGGGMPGGGGPPEGFDPGDLPEGAPPEGFDPGAMPAPGQGPGGDRGGRGGMFGGNNILVSRFHEDASFEAVYQGKLDDLRADLFGTGTAASLLDDRATLLESIPELVDAATVKEEADLLRGRFDATAAAGD
jgi:spore coat protein CotH